VTTKEGHNKGEGEVRNAVFSSDEGGVEGLGRESDLIRN
jgi:hypothetical protein